jgi:peptidoglycan/LPS O-acetylase OafA/YrhL
MSVAYRADIDGLRAVAVLSVLIFHMFPTALPSGFIGVDIFFVISGYLISKIILKELDEGKFSFKYFWVKRVVRIFPSLLVVLASSALLGWFFLLPIEFVSLGKHIFVGAVFASNILLFQEVGYFDTSAELKPLLHLWSLGIEEQFYIIWPILLYTGWRYFSRHLTLIIGLLITASLVAAELRVRVAPEETFFLLHTRMWELLLGAFLAQKSFTSILNPKLSSILSVAGTLLIIFGLFFLGQGERFPGVSAILPALGATLLIAAGPGGVINKRFLSCSLLVKIGLISYPLYLWHWPLVSILKNIYGVHGVPDSYVVGAGLLSFLLAGLTYKVIEQPIKTLSINSKLSRSYLLSCCMAGVAVFGFLMHKKKVQPLASGELYQKVSYSKQDWGFPGSLRPEVSEDGIRYWRFGVEAPEIMVMGDSNAEMYLPRIEKLVAEKKISQNIIFVTHGGCPPIPNVRDKRPATASCPRYTEFGYKVSSQDSIKKVFIIANWALYLGKKSNYFIQALNQSLILNEGGAGQRKAFKQLEEMVQMLKSLNKSVYILSNIPQSRLLTPGALIRRSLFSFTPIRSAPPVAIPRSQVESTTLPTTKELNTISQRAGIKVINPFDFLCEDRLCSGVDKVGTIIFRDSNHIRASFARENLLFLDEALRDSDDKRQRMPINK